MDNSLDSALNPFRLIRLRIRLKPEEAFYLPPQAGSSVRGALGMTVKNLVCVRRELPLCSPCPLVNNCAYPYLFETAAPAEERGTRGFEQFPRPYVISYPPPAVRLGAATDAASPRGGALEQVEREIGLTLVGRALLFFPYLALALRDMENRGLGRGRGRFELAGLHAVDLAGRQFPLYLAAEGMLNQTEGIINGTELVDHSKLLVADSVKLLFLSPTSLQFKGKTAHEPEFHILIRSLLRRVSMLSLGHCEARMEIDFAEWIRRAESVKLVNFASRSVEWERFSNRQDRRVPMRGFVGEAGYAGDVEPFRALLLLGSLLHIGDNCTYGMGRYVLGAADDDDASSRTWLPVGWNFSGEVPVI